MAVAMVSSTGRTISPSVDMQLAKTSAGGNTGATFAALLKPLDAAGKTIIRNERDPYVQLEAVFLRNFVEAMLPKEESGLMDSGIAGDYWRSMLADQISTAVAITGKMGIADTLRGRSAVACSSGN